MVNVCMMLVVMMCRAYVLYDASYSDVYDVECEIVIAWMFMCLCVLIREMICMMHYVMMCVLFMI